MTMMTTETLSQVLTAGQVRRYHTIPGFPGQSIAEHSWRGIVILLYLAPTISKEAIVSFVSHDVPERVTGDVPRDAKWEYPTLDSMLKAIENKELKRLGLQTVLSKEEEKLLHAADGLELMWHCLDQRRLGNQNADVVFHRMLEAIRKDFEVKGRILAVLTYLVEQYCVVGYPQATNALEGVLDELIEKPDKHS